MNDKFSRTGTVLTTDGEPVPGAFITIKHSSVHIPEIVIVTDVNGHFKINLPNGIFTLQAFANDWIGEIQFTNPDNLDLNIILSKRS